MQDLRREVLDGNLNPQTLPPVQGKSSFQGVSQRSGYAEPKTLSHPDL